MNSDINNARWDDQYCEQLNSAKLDAQYSHHNRRITFNHNHPS